MLWMEKKRARCEEREKCSEKCHSFFSPPPNFVPNADVTLRVEITGSP